MKYDVDIFINEETPDDDFICGPLSGGFCDVFAEAEKAAQLCNGGWGDWEPYRCTYGFPNKESQDKFCKILEKDIIDKYKINYKKYN